MTETEFRTHICKSKGWGNYVSASGHIRYGYQNFITIEQFLKDHNLATREKVNGFSFFVLTQKAHRTKWRNLFIVKQIVNRRDLDKATEILRIISKHVTPTQAAHALANDVFYLNKENTASFVERFVEQEYLYGFLADKHFREHIFCTLKEMRSAIKWVAEKTW